MAAALFVAGFCLLTTVMLGWGFRHLPREKWQFLASLPSVRQPDGCWRGVNLTYYGVFNANAYLLATAVGICLLAALGIPCAGFFWIVAALLGVCVPASKLIARLVEKKKYTFSVGGAAFVGILGGPPLVWGLGRVLQAHMGVGLPLAATLAALAIAYAVGEGVGRLACISFGCCYGKPLSRTHPLIRRLFGKCSFVFQGATKKIAFADGLDGQAVVPVQALTAIVYCGAAAVGLALFFGQWYRAAFLEVVVVTQLWRFFSEFLRADYRGAGRISKYQTMSLVAAGAAVPFALLCPPSVAAVDILAGLRSLWRPGILVFLQGLWLFAFFYTGRSQVTGARIHFHVLQDRI
ncbi:MAG: prolipoprotein diacylglyceryl transferase [Desulfobacteraceae bacterium]